MKANPSSDVTGCSISQWHWHRRRLVCVEGVVRASEFELDLVCVGQLVRAS